MPLFSLPHPSNPNAHISFNSDEVQYFHTLISVPGNKSAITFYFKDRQQGFTIEYKDAAERDETYLFLLSALAR